jgi:tRNA (uracil-5-)-methyltransferase TRM9
MNNIEKLYVHDVYNSISNEFSNTRQYPWPVVRKFVNSLDRYSTVCDVGCGNGKNMFRDDLVYFPTDLSIAMCNTAQKQKSHFDITQSNVLSLPFKDNTFDAVMCIACIHHLNSAERRARAVYECARILKHGGKLLISVWANSEKYGSGDQYIGWNTHDQKRFYHLFDEKELRVLCDFQCDIIYEKHNYYLQATSSKQVIQHSTPF